MGKNIGYNGGGLVVVSLVAGIVVLTVVGIIVITAGGAIIRDIVIF